MDCIFTKRLCLRKIEEEDLELISAWSCSKAAHGEYLSPGNHTYQDCYDRWQNATYWNDHSKTLIIELKEKKQPLGTIRYWLKANDHSTAMVALKIAEPAFRGQGFGTEAQRGIVHFLFVRNHYSAVEMFTDIDNVPEQRCLAKLGFTLADLQTYEDQKVQRQGRVYRLIRSEFNNRLLDYV